MGLCYGTWTALQTCLPNHVAGILHFHLLCVAQNVSQSQLQSRTGRGEPSLGNGMCLQEGLDEPALNASARAAF